MKEAKFQNLSELFLFQRSSHFVFAGSNKRCLGSFILKGSTVTVHNKFITNIDQINICFQRESRLIKLFEYILIAIKQICVTIAANRVVSYVYCLEH